MPHIDRKFLVMLGILLVLGLVVLTSASGPVAFQKFGDSYWYVRHQVLFGLLPGVILFFILSHLDYRAVRRLARPAFFVSLVLLLLVFVPGIGAEWGSARSWINVFGLSFQPAEFAKLALVLLLADWLANKENDELRDPQLGLLPFCVMVGMVSLLVILQPDLGSLSVIVATSAIVFFLAGAPWLHLFGIAAVGSSALWLLIRSAPYRAARFMTFLHPELDPQGIGYHINQAYLAIGSGGLFGLGLGHSRQKFMYLPEVVGDSVFAVMAEEFGLILSVCVVALMTALMFRMLAIARRAPDRFSSLLVAGIAAWVASQILINIGGMVGLFPMTGLPLPFMSYGGTALMVMLAALGIVANVSRQIAAAARRPVTAFRL